MMKKRKIAKNYQIKVKNMSKLKIVVCSKNKSKNNAVLQVLHRFFDDFEIFSLNTASCVSETPVGDEEGVLGCKNRILDAMKQFPDADIYIAMEGIINKFSFGTFLYGWTVVYNKNKNEYSYGCSAKVEVPEVVASQISKDERLSKIVAKWAGSTDEEISKLGTNGLLTNGEYTRTAEFVDSVRLALSEKFKVKNQ